METSLFRFLFMVRCAIIASHRGSSTKEEMVATQALTVLLKTASSIGSTAPALVQDGALW